MTARLTARTVPSRRRTAAVTRALAALSALAFAVVAAACASSDTTTTGPAVPGSPGGTGGDAPAKLVIATTVAPLTSITSAVVGDLATVTGIVPEGTNSHTFEPPPSAAEILSEADLVFLNGLQLEEPTKELAEANRKEGSEIVELGRETISEEQYKYDVSFPEEEGKPNPHLWTNPPMVKRYAEIVRDTVIERDPANAGAYTANYDAYVAAVDELDQAMRTSFETIPADQRKLLTYHDAYAYFAEDYGWTVIGAIQVSDFEDPSPKEVADLIDQVRAEDVKAIFGSEVFPSPVLEQIGNETGVRYVDVLRDDDLPGEPGAPEHSLLGLLRFDYVTMTEALGGDASALKDVDLSIATPDTAVYPQ
jgi:ABC-type Zn uptake system ZnuABC Zn-binding protein ZnuA